MHLRRDAIIGIRTTAEVFTNLVWRLRMARLNRKLGKLPGWLSNSPEGDQDYGRHIRILGKRGKVTHTYLVSPDGTIDGAPLGKMAHIGVILGWCGGVVIPVYYDRDGMHASYPKEC